MRSNEYPKKKSELRLDAGARDRSVADPSDWVTRLRPGSITRVPTHTVGRAPERRAYIRARLSLPLRVQRIAGRSNSKPYSLHTADISSSGIFFLFPQPLSAETPLELEVLLVDRPFGRGSVRMCTTARVVRSQESNKQGWHGLAAVFDDIRFVRDDHESLS